MTVEFARMRIAKIRNDLAYSTNGLNNKLGLISKKEEDSFLSLVYNLDAIYTLRESAYFSLQPLNLILDY